MLSSEYVRNQYVQNMGWFKESCHLSKHLKFIIVTCTISLVECHRVEGYMHGMPYAILTTMWK